MNSVKKLFIKNDFLKAIEGHPTGWSNRSLYYFEGDVYTFNRMIDENFAHCLSNLFNHKVVVIPSSSDESRLVFSIPDFYDIKYELSNGKISLHEDICESNKRYDFTRYSESLKLISEAYDKMMSMYKLVEIPLTDRVSFCYSFYAGKYFLLKDKKNLNKGVNIHLTSSQENQDTDQDCYYPWLTFEVLIKRIRISPDYSVDLKSIEEKINDIFMDLRKDLGLVKAKQDHENVSKVAIEEPERFIIREDNLFEVINGIKFVREEWKRQLRYLDLKDISFKGVYVAGLDFRGSNAVINPDEVYDRNLSNCRFDSMSCSTDFTFDGCNVHGMMIGEIILDQEKKRKR